MYENELYHYGTKRHSGRYPYGSGDEPFQHDSDFLKQVKELQDQGLSEVDIAKEMGMSTTEFRKRKTLEKDSLRSDERAFANKLKDKGYSNVAIGERLGRNESYVRTLLDPVMTERARKTENIAAIIKESVDKQDYIDIGPGSEVMLGVNRTKMMTSIKKLEDEGYTRQYIKVEQSGIPGQYTYIQVLAKPGVEYREIYDNRDNIGFAVESMNIAKIRAEKGDIDISQLGIRKPVSVDSNRIDIRYAEDGGKDKDGVIELRRGTEDLSLGYSNYAQVRIAVDGTHYLKGMAVYTDDLPDGIDIRFNTNKTKDTPKMKVLKEMKTNPDGSINWDNPFGATLEMKDGLIIGQSDYVSKDGTTKQSAINIVRSEGSWNTWSNTLASQFLSKQPLALIKQQLTKSYDQKKDEFDEISKLTNPEIKKMMLDQFANDCDASASHLKAAALPRQSSKVILPLIDISDNEIYAPGYEDGEEVVLVRYPHGGTFEIPKLIVNNKNKEGKAVLGKQAIDAVGINSKVAERLSGADFDGDTVVVIPTKNQKIKTSSPLAGLVGFDPKEAYGPKSYEGLTVKIMKDGAEKQKQMGSISNLITDMTLQGASDNELARAVRHSMVVIDAPKHKLNFKQSEIDNNIAELKTKYQGGPRSGASTLISLASAEQRVPKAKEIKNPSVMTKEELADYKEGKLIFRTTGETYTKKNAAGESIDILRVDKKTKMGFRKDGSVRDDAFELSSGTPQENYYASYANKLKKLANDARKEYRETPNSKYSPSAKETYAKEVASLNEKLKGAILNSPYERQAQLISDKTIKTVLKANPDMDSDEIKKLRTQSLAAARAKTGASKSSRSIDISDREWEAIQAGAISSSRLMQILQNTDTDKVKQLATPRNSIEISNAQIAKINSLAKSGYTTAEIAKSVGVSTKTVNEYLNK